MELTQADLKLIYSALENDTQGTWGDKRSEYITILLTKIGKELKKDKAVA